MTMPGKNTKPFSFTREAPPELAARRAYAGELFDMLTDFSCQVLNGPAG